MEIEVVKHLPLPINDAGRREYDRLQQEAKRAQDARAKALLREMEIEKAVSEMDPEKRTAIAVWIALHS